MHASRIFLTDITALGETHPVLRARVCLQPQRCVGAEFGHAFDNPERQPVREPARRRFAALGDPALAEACFARITHTQFTLRHPMHRQLRVDLDCERQT